MKKAAIWLTVLACAAAFADSGATYLRLAWSVPAESIAAVNAKYVNLYAEAGGVRVGAEGRATFDGAAVSAATIVRGADGWDWSSADASAATFKVEFLNAELGVIAVSDPVAYSTLAAADAFEANGTGSFAPVNGTTPYVFSGVNVDSDGIWEELKTTFGDNAKVVPVADAGGAIVAHVVTLEDNMTGPVALKANLGAVTLDLNGHSISGTNAVNGAAAAGGNAIEIAGLLDPDTGKTTALTIRGTAATGYAGAVSGGKGADGVTGFSGGHAVAVASGVEGVTVAVEGGAVVKGGASGNSASGEPTAGATALLNATLLAGEAANGDAGTAQTPWAWAECTYAGAELPAGTTQDGATLRFWRRENGRASFDFGALAGQAIADGTIHFVAGNIDVDTFDVPSAAGALAFAGEDSTVLKIDAAKSAFDVASAADQVRVWTNLVFEGSARLAWDGGCSDGAGIFAAGGVVKILACRFEGCVPGQLGGAVCAHGLSDGSEISDSVFADNGVYGVNVSGGALYASAATEGATLTIRRTAFTGNAALNGGAICTETAWDDFPVALAVENCSFEDNEAGWTGGAIDAEGDLFVDASATVETPGTTTFVGNFASVAGGAVEIGGIAGDVAPAVVSIGRGVVFADNMASNAEEYVTGGAIDVQTPGATLRVTGAAFARNVAYGSGEGGAGWDLGAYGGAVCATDGAVDFDTCVFDANRAVPVKTAYAYYGGALELGGCGTRLMNCTFRGSNVEAVDVYGGAVAVTNCVLVGNGLDFAADAAIDFNLDGSAAADVAYSAWGQALGALAGDYMNLSNRTTAVYASDDSLHLAETGFNPVAALGVNQTGARDFDGVLYGSKTVGSAMGAFEAATAPVVVYVHGEKTYDGNATSNGTAWSDWALVDTNGASIAWSDLASSDAELAALFAITAWDYGNRNAGEFARTAAAPQGVSAAFEGASEEIRRWMEQGFVTFDYTGTIQRRPIAEGGLEIALAPDEYPYTGNPVVARIVALDTLPEGGEALADDYDQALSFANNVNPTASAVVTVDMLRNYVGTTNFNYAITAYFVEYTFDGVVKEDLTKTYGETSRVAVAVSPADLPDVDNPPAGYAWDWQNSLTNDVVRRIDADDGLLRLQVRFCTDANGDRVPDKYQRQILAKIVNGEWADGTALDQARWATLTNSAGLWAADGAGALTEFALTAGARARTGFKAGGWLAFEDGQLKEVADPAAYRFSAGQIPFLVYAYLHDMGGTSGGGRTGSGRGGRPGSEAAASETVAAQTLLEQYGALMTVKEATLTAGQLKIKTQLVVKDNVSGTTLADVPVDGAALRLFATEKLGPEAEWSSQGVVPDEHGVITVDLAGESAFYKVGL